ncbi:MAG: T9SS type A sorting domain-containing protein, partial [Taibaiella sp.]|nr:T9SS type A sorting domain-containing protein [Taibaiella sp.]
VTVNPLPGTITGTASACVGSSTTFSSATSGGTWSSSSTSVATVGATSGNVSGISAGTVTITYTLGTGCITTTIATINALPAAITGAGSVCVAATITLASTTTGGTWASSAAAVATAGATTGIITGVSAGTAAITYTLPTGCIRTATVTVNPLPVAGTVSGLSTVCVAASTTLSSTISGGIWSNTTGKVTVGMTTGVITGVSAGLDTVKYSVSNVCGTATATYPVTVNPLPVAGTISGSSNVCVSLTTALTPSVAGGSWTTGSATFATVSGAGVVTGVAAGVVNITYTVSNSCGSATTTKTLTVNSLVDAGSISGTDSVCQGDTITLSNAVTGGTWGSSNATIASVTSTGVVIGITPGTATIRYIVANVCSMDTATLVIKVKSAASCATSVLPIPEKGNAGIRLYPNPTTGLLNITSPEDGTLTVYTIDGKEVSSYKITTSAASVTLPGGLSGGVYMCRFTGNDGSQAIVRLVYQP